MTLNGVCVMAHTNFHNETFDDGTRLKLEIFRGYIREWLPVFLSGTRFKEVHIYDFFSGPGTDAAGNPGSPLVILDELDKYMQSERTVLAPGVKIVLHFNDIDCEKIATLQEIVGQRRGALPCEVKYTSMEFRLAFMDNLHSIQDAYTANLVIMDQYGIKEVNKDVFETLVHCVATDILFFISSSFIRRFIKDESVQQHFRIPEKDIRDVDAKSIHRYICREFYQKLVPHGKKYHVVPFSIEKDGGSNIYGIIFGSGNLLGLDKFLRVCWDKDTVTGEANYDIDDDIVRSGQMALFEEHSVIKKQDQFQRALTEFIRQHKPDNCKLYEFVLGNGFLPRHANDILRDEQHRDTLSVVDCGTGQKARAGAFYLSYKEHTTEPKVRFSMKDTIHVL